VNENDIYIQIRNQRQYLLNQGLPPHVITTKIFLTHEDLLKLIAERNIINPPVAIEHDKGVTYKFCGHDVEQTVNEKSFVITGVCDE
jgi:hypothetical protein